ncbi:hypothetical protein CQW23_01152 [Capsicum baccatum]|uniref:Uncharacterized protein n=1 Tax=Capsicum baccatum TaxID=33114 RepID=A0A2G2XMW5_CAPBA|nr:hypothetical protein CQW23_01152 [Capsicum baccatum]
MCPIPQMLLEPRHRKYNKVKPLVMIVGSQGTPIGEDKSLGVEKEIANVEIGMNTEQYEPIDRGKECTSESKIMNIVIAFPNEISDEMDNNYAIEEDKEGIGEPWKEVDEEGKRINSIDFSLSSAINLITELDVLTGLKLTYDGKLEVMDVLNFMKNSGLVAPTTMEKIEIDFCMWGEVSLMVSSSGNNLFPGANVPLKRAHEGHQDKANIIQGSTLSLGASYKIIRTVDQSIPWSFLLSMLALANFKRLENGERNIVASLKEKKCSYHVDYKSKLRQLKHSLKFMNKLYNTINVERHRLSCILRLIIVLSVLSIVSFTWFIIYGLGGKMQQQLLMVMKMQQQLLMVMKMHSLPDGLAFAIRSKIDTTKTTFISRVMKRRYGIKDVFLPCDLLRDILTGREHLHCSRRLTHFKGAILHQILEEFLKDSNLFCGEAVDKAFGKQGRYMRRRLNVATLLVPKTADRKFFDIELKDILLCWFFPCCMTLLSMKFGSIIAHGKGYP